ncbi:MAG: hypothetical protein QS721_09770 [Candidatus Endonucleobacter sp. (ex Gigantidas childressi)]|nr:hypothetical protein [Candidatus Endonucleobacter sp. (ex Gigantidas childressi)]
MKLKIKAKAFIGCLMAGFLFSTPLLAGVQLSLAKVSDVDRESLKAYVESILDKKANNYTLFSEIDLLMQKEIFYVSLVQNCTEAVCNYDKDRVDAVLDEKTERAIKVAYAHQIAKGATTDDFAAWKEENLCPQGCDYLNILKDSFKNIKVVNVESTRIFMMDIDDDSKVKISFDSAGKIIGIKREEVDANRKYDVEYIITHSDTTINASESTFCEGPSDSTEDKSVPGGMVTNLDVTVTLDYDGNVIKKTGKIYVYDHLLSFGDDQIKLKDDALSSTANGDYVSIEELSGDGCVSIEELSGDGILRSLRLNNVDTRNATCNAAVATILDGNFVTIESSQP